MAAPPKPWERMGTNSQLPCCTNPVNQMSSMTDLGSASRATGMGAPLLANQNPPPVPVRPTTQRPGLSGLGSYGSFGSGLGGYGGYSSSMYSPYGSSLYGAGGMYGGSYGSTLGGYGMNSYGNQFGQSGFAQIAEENSRQAFQSIESIVQAFGSVAMMLESTYSAVFNSFRAVIGVADHFSRLRTHLTQVFSALAVIRTLKWLYRKLLIWLRLRPGGLEEDAWEAATKAGQEFLQGNGKSGGNRTSWPIMMFFAVVIGGPWLIWKFLSSLSKSADGENWASGEDDHFVAVAEYDFDQESDAELTFRKGTRINIAPKEMQPRMRGWLLGSVDGKKTGILPANYVKILGKRRGRRHMANINPQDTSEAQSNQTIAPPVGETRETSGDKNKSNGANANIFNGKQTNTVCKSNEIQYMDDAFSQTNTSPCKSGQSSVTEAEAADILEASFTQENNIHSANSIVNKDAADILDNTI